MANQQSDIGKEIVAFLPVLRRFAISLCRSRDLADDLVQSACERALLGAERFEPGTRLDSWLFRILRNLWIDHLRRQKTAGIPDDIADHAELAGTNGDAEVEGRSDLRSVSEAIGRLPPEQREVLLLVCVEDLSYKDTADILSIPIGTVMSRLARARKNLMEMTGIKPDVTRLPGHRTNQA
ncbi:RNA polymerase sigma factor [Rhizobium sp. TRM95111]|uniref:RNA polymerase sigma factor n=1 Tax=Rhizobium alarense TaxID=2846851 RepID=UPI001F21971F|nr:RNA polymerase sigma factor [Rhizobium alarense]MCF3642101.1 RNA polymerase sigma factor [Rhizobium alarense]